MGKPNAILIAGPTASGKSALAVRLAREVGGVVVNADAMQVYDGLRILTARPEEAEVAGVEHRLYGHIDPARNYSVGEWARDVGPLLEELSRRGKVPVFCGGTGLYFRALLEGLDEMPAVPPEVRDRWRRRLGEEGMAALHAELVRRDPEAAGRIRPSDPQRILRALELGEVGGTLRALQAGRGRPLLDCAAALKVVLTPDRAMLRERIAQRFDQMLEAGAADEARAFAARPAALAGLAGKAIGVAELLAVDNGKTTMEVARDRAVTRTRQYAKRQETWFRHQFDGEWLRVKDPGEVRL